MKQDENKIFGFDPRWDRNPDTPPSMPTRLFIDCIHRAIPERRCESCGGPPDGGCICFDCEAILPMRAVR